MERKIPTPNESSPTNLDSSQAQEEAAAGNVESGTSDVLPSQIIPRDPPTDAVAAGKGESRGDEGAEAGGKDAQESKDEGRKHGKSSERSEQGNERKPAGGKPPIANAEDLVEQLEYYFSDRNLQKDVFLRSQMQDDQAVPIQVLEAFPRVQAFLRRLPEENRREMMVLCAQSSQLLTVTDDKAAIKRKTPFQMPTDAEGQEDVRTLVVKNLSP